MCFIDEWDIETGGCSVTKTPRARKRHACCECSRTIEPGETYEQISGVYDHEPYRTRTCMRCVRVRAALESEVRKDHMRVPIGELRCCLRERIEDRFLARVPAQ